MPVWGILNEDSTVQRCIVVSEGATPEDVATLAQAAPERCVLLPGDGIPGAGLWHGEWLRPYRQIVGADDPENPDIPAGYLAGARVWAEGRGWTNLLDGAVHPPSLSEPTTWAPEDGTPVALTGTAYPVGWELVIDGLWHRCLTPTHFLPSAFPAAWVQITGPGGAVVAPEPEPDDWPEWVAGVAVQVGAGVTHDGRRWTAKIAHITHAGWAPSVHTHAVWTDEGPAP